MKTSMSRREVVVTACLASIAIWAVPSMAAPVSFKVPLTGAQQVPPVKTAATGTADLAYDPATRVVTWNVSYSGLSGAATMAHFHGPAAEGKNGPPVIWLAEKCGMWPPKITKLAGFEIGSTKLAALAMKAQTNR